MLQNLMLEISNYKNTYIYIHLIHRSTNWDYENGFLHSETKNIKYNNIIITLILTSMILLVW